MDKLEKIESFEIDHTRLNKGIYKSLEDGDIVTCDLRIRTPYKDELMSNAEMHSLEHVLASVLRNGSYSEHVIYVGPMGCQTGFYCIFKDMLDTEMIEVLVEAFHYIATTQIKMPGAFKKQCGYNENLDFALAQKVAVEFYEIIKDKAFFDLYP